MNPLLLSHVLASFDRLPYDSELVLCEDDVRWKSFEDIADEIEARQKALKKSPQAKISSFLFAIYTRKAI